MSQAMPIASWQDYFYTGDRQVDLEHQALFNQVNTLYEALIQGENPKTLRSILEALACRTIEHFCMEEPLMQSQSYPGHERHQHSHDSFPLWEISSKFIF